MCLSQNYLHAALCSSSSRKEKRSNLRDPPLSFHSRFNTTGPFFSQFASLQSSITHIYRGLRLFIASPSLDSPHTRSRGLLTVSGCYMPGTDKHNLTDSNFPDNCLIVTQKDGSIFKPAHKTKGHLQLCVYQTNQVFLKGPSEVKLKGLSLWMSLSRIKTVPLQFQAT